MLTIKLDIETNNNQFILDKQQNYSFAFRKLFKNYNLISDKLFLNNLKLKYNLQDYELNCLKIDVKTKYEQFKTSKEQLEDKIVSISNDIKVLENKESLTKKEKRNIFKLKNKLRYSDKQLSKGLVFGGLNNLQKLSFLNNNKEKNSNDILKIKNIYQEQRILPLNYIGSLNDSNSNRYFNFDFINKQIIYKPNSKTKIELTYKSKKNIDKILLRLHELKDNKVLPISVKLTTKYIYITFDEEKLFNFGFNEKDYKNDLEKLDKDNPNYLTLKKELTFKWFKEQEERMFKDKNINRYCSIDLNPEHIGCSILEKNNEGFKILDKFNYDLIDLSKKEIKTDKRKHEISNIYKSLFKVCEHYGCSHFVMEDLNFKSKNINEGTKEGNRKIKNIWNINYQKNLINKYCKIKGLKLIEVNPCYSSFIGNIKYNYFDSINASIEIGRRGLNKYDKGANFYPKIGTDDLGTMSNLIKKSNGDVLKLNSINSWVGLYRLAKDTESRYRRTLCETSHNVFSKDNKKSLVKLYTFQ